MPISVQCPSCSAKLNAPDNAAGKRVKCPKCTNVVSIPAPVVEYEVVEDDPPPTPVGKKPRPVEDDAPRPAKRPLAAKPKPAPVEVDEPVDDEEEDDTPKKKRRRDSGDEDDTPTKKGKGKRGKAQSNLPLLLGVGGGVIVLLVVVGVIVGVMMGGDGGQAKTTGGGQPRATGPAETLPTSKTPSSNPTATPPLEMTADQLAKEFENPETSVNKLGRYASKTIRLSGVVDHVGMNEPFVYLETNVADRDPYRPNTTLKVMLEFSKDIPKLVPGTKVVIEGRVHSGGKGGPGVLVQRLVSSEGDKVLDLKVVVTDGKLTINDTPIPAKTDLATVEKVLGKPTRIDEKEKDYSTIYWKAYGVRAQLRKDTKQFQLMQFTFDGGFYESGDGNFEGPFTIDGVSVKQAKADDLKDKLKFRVVNGGPLRMDFKDGTSIWLLVDGQYKINVVSFNW